MRAMLLKLRRFADDQQRSRPGEAQLWHIGVALAVSFTVALLGLAGLAGLAWVLVSLGGFRRNSALSLHDTVSLSHLDLGVAGVWLDHGRRVGLGRSEAPGR